MGQPLQDLLHQLRPGAAKPGSVDPAGGEFEGDVSNLGQQQDPPEVIYRFRKHGRTVFTNIVDEVPEDQLQGAAMDLSDIPLNSELGTKIEQRLEQEHERLVETSYCDDALQAASAGTLQLIWERYKILVIFGGLLLLLLLISPWVLRRVDAPRWARTLTTVIPMIAVIGLLSFTMSKASSAISAVKRKATPCQKATWDNLKHSNNPLSQHAQLIQDLQRQIDGLAEPVTERGVD